MSGIMNSAKDSAFSLCVTIYDSYGEKEMNPKIIDSNRVYFQLLILVQNLCWVVCFKEQNRDVHFFLFCWIKWRDISWFLKRTNKFRSGNYCLWKWWMFAFAKEETVLEYRRNRVFLRQDSYCLNPSALCKSSCLFPTWFKYSESCH